MKRVSRKTWKVLCDDRKRERTKIMTEGGRKKEVEEEEEGMEVKRKLPGHENLTPGNEKRRKEQDGRKEERKNERW